MFQSSASWVRKAHRHADSRIWPSTEQSVAIWVSRGGCSSGGGSFLIPGL